MIEQAISRSKNVAFGMAAMPSMTLLFNVVIVIKVSDMNTLVDSL